MRRARAPVAAIALAALATPPAVRADPARDVYELRLAFDIPVAAVSTLAIAVPNLLAGEIIAKRCPCDPSEVNGFDRGAIGNHRDAADVVSTVTVLLAMALPPIADLADVGATPVLVHDVGVFAETLLVNGALVEAAKYVVQRPLPRTYAGDPTLVGSAGGYRSFYSGHTSTAFAALVATAYTIRLRYGEQVWPWFAVGAVGASVGIERVVAGRHFPSDVLVGAAMGTAVGLAVPWLHARWARTRITLAPAAAGHGLAVVGTL